MGECEFITIGSSDAFSILKSFGYSKAESANYIIYTLRIVLATSTPDDQRP